MIQLSLLGTIDLTAEDGRTLHSVLAQPKRLALLAYLAAAQPRGFHRRDTLLALFWPESTEEDARHSLRQSLYYLRRSLGEAVIQSRGDEIGIDPERFGCDAAAFDRAVDEGRLEGALDLYQGDFLEGFFVSDAPEFERWVDAERSRLKARAARTMWVLSERAEGEADPAAAVSWARRASSLGPPDEGAVRRLIALLDRTGDRAGALLAYEDLARWLEEEFGAQPSPETQALAIAIRGRCEPVPALDASVPVAPGERQHPERPERTEDLEEGSAPAFRGTRRRWILPALMGAAALLLLATFALTPSEQSRLIEHRVLVTALANETGDAALDPLGGWAADWMIQGLQASGRVEVIDPATGYIFARDSGADSPGLTGFPRAHALAEEVGAGTVVWGAYRQSGDSLFFDVTVSDVLRKTRRHTLAVAGRATEHSVLVGHLRERVAGALVASLDERIASLSSSTSPPPTLEAYQEYVAGLEFFTRHQPTDAYPHFLRAAEMDSTFVLPRFWALFSLGNTEQYERMDSLLRTMLPLRERLTPLDRHSLDWFVTNYQQQDRVAALAHAREAARLAPHSNWVYIVANTLQNVHKPHAALDALGQLDPQRGWVKGWLHYWRVRTRSHHLLGQFTEALEEIDRGRKNDPDAVHLILFRAEQLAALGRIGELRALLDTVAMLPKGSQWLRPDLAFLRSAQELSRHGHPAGAEEVFGRLERYLVSLPPPETEAEEEARRFRWAEMLYHSGRWQEAAPIIQELSARDPESVEYQMYGAIIAAHRGDRSGAERILRGLDSRFDVMSAGRARKLLSHGRAAAALGERDRAVVLIREAISQGAGYWWPELHLDRDLGRLRGYRPFQEAVRPRG